MVHRPVPLHGNIFSPITDLVYCCRPVWPEQYGEEHDIVMSHPNSDLLQRGKACLKWHRLNHMRAILSLHCARHDIDTITTTVTVGAHRCWHTPRVRMRLLDFMFILRSGGIANLSVFSNMSDCQCFFSFLLKLLFLVLTPHDSKPALARLQSTPRAQN